MKPEEVIEVLNEILDVLGHNHYSNSREYIAVDTAIEALEKQVPKKPNAKELSDVVGRMYWNVCGACDEEMDSEYDYCPECGQRTYWNVCGACDEEIDSEYDYCPSCGQAIDWGNNE